MSTNIVYRMKEYPEYARPRERMEMLGAEQLSDQELLAILLATGSKEYSALDLAERLLQSHKGLPGLRELSLDELMEQKGIGAAKATTIAAAIELGKRICYSSCDYRPVIDSPSGAAELLQGQMRYLDREHFQVMLLNQKKAVLSIETISIGTLSSSLVHPREVFKPAIKRSASTMILAHNHPSGDCVPSEYDIQVTHRLKAVGEIVGIEVIDHIIIGEDKYYSFLENSIF